MRDDNNDTNQNDSNLLTEYTVEERDTIPELERKLGMSWSELREANPEIIGNTNMLQSGVRLRIPNKRT